MISLLTSTVHKVLLFANAWLCFRDTQNEKKRVEILGQSPLTCLNVNLRVQMVKKPSPGQVIGAFIPSVEL